MSDFPKIHVSADSPLDKTFFIVPRKFEIAVLPIGERVKVWLETEEEWARKCGMITGLKAE